MQQRPVRRRLLLATAVAAFVAASLVVVPVAQASDLIWYEGHQVPRAAAAYVNGTYPSGAPRVDWTAYNRDRQAAVRLFENSQQTQAQVQRAASTSAIQGRVGRGVTTITTVPKAATGGKVAVAARGVGQAATAAFGLDLGYTAGGAVMEGVFGVESSGLWCDVQQLFGSTGCRLEADAGYVPNSDVMERPDGFVVWPWEVNVGIFTALSVDVNPEGTAATMHGSFTRTVGGSGGQGTTGYLFRCYDPVTELITARGQNLRNDDTAENQIRYTGTYTATVECAPGEVVWDFRLSTSSLWNSTYNPEWVPGIGGDPQRWWRTTWSCQLPGQGITTHSLLSEPFYESQPEWPEFPLGECIGENVAMTSVKVEQVTEGLSDLLIYEWEAPVETVEWAHEATPEERSGGVWLELHRVDDLTGARLACFDNMTLCADWLNDPDRDDNYVCTYGGADVDLSSCLVYGPTFRTDLLDQGHTHGDPSTGQVAGGGPGTDPTELPAPQADCPPPFTWLSLINPWYYFKGTVCALELAFVPSPGFLQTEFETTRDMAVNRPPWSLAEPVGATFGGMGEGWDTACAGFADFTDGYQLRIPCEPPAAQWVGVLRAVMIAAIVGSTAFGVWHMLVGSLGGNRVD